ncbi:MAG: cohesin domain-containing protein, partial [Anaerolineae bacterium]|nr:cohesin domain-containing protein [Anaerolineae bacterium]
TSDSSWLKIISGSSGTNTGTITVSYKANTTNSQRVGTVTVTAVGATGSPKAVTVTQTQSAILSVVPENRTVPHTAGSTTFSVTNIGNGTMNWCAASGSDWLTITPPPCGTNAGTITAAYTANTTNSERIGTITVTADGAMGSPKQVTVTQAGPQTPQAEIFPDCPTTAKGSVNTEFDVPINIENVTNLFGVSFELNFNKTYLNAKSEAAGPCLGDNIIFYSQHDSSIGKVSIAVSRKQGQGGVSGTCVVAIIRFRVMQGVTQPTPVEFTLSAISATDPSGNPINLMPSPCTTILQPGIPVWPGDTDNNGTVNQADVLRIGLHWNQTGPRRLTTGCGWTDQSATPWTPLNATYADCNGDSIVNQADILCIGLNWQKTHTLSLSVLPSRTDFLMESSGTSPLVPVLKYSAVNEYDVEIMVGDAQNPVENLFGISYVVRYDPTKLRIPLPHNSTVMPGDFLGANLPVWFTNVDTLAGKISIGMSRAGVPNGVSGTGKLANIKFRLTASAQIGQTTQIRIEDVAANDQHGNPITLAPQSTDIVVSVEEFDALPGQFVLYQNYPNPFNPETTIKFALPKPSHVKIQIYNMLGQPVRKLLDENVQAGERSVKWDSRDEQGSEVPSGVYLYKIEADNFTATRKLLLTR